MSRSSLSAFPSVAKAKLRAWVQYRLYRQKWNIGVIPQRASVVAGLEGEEAQARALEQVQWLAEDRQTFAADPFIAPAPASAPDNDGQIIYFEGLEWSEGIGLIEAVNFKDGEFSNRREIIRRADHLSYPHVFAHEGQVRVIPESAEARETCAYSINDDGSLSREFALQIGGDHLDTTLLYHGGLFWLFCTKLSLGGNSDLHIYYSDSLGSDWTAHAANPVKRDLASARPAGQFIPFEGKIYRPAQDCAQYYGAGIAVHEVTELSPTGFAEHQVSEIRPLAGSRYDYGLHTISSLGDLTVIDAARRESAIHPLFDR